MTKQEWIQKDLSFYHITRTKNIDSILENGLQNKNGKGICVVRTKDLLVVRYICETMLNDSYDLDFSIIELKPSEINLTADELLDDSVVEITNPLHNYIQRNKIEIKIDMVNDKTFRAEQLGIANLEEYERNLRNKVNIEFLT